MLIGPRNKKNMEKMHQQSDTPTSNTTLDANRKLRKTPRYALRGMLGSTRFRLRESSSQRTHSVAKPISVTTVGFMMWGLFDTI